LRKALELQFTATLLQHTITRLPTLFPGPIRKFDSTFKKTLLTMTISPSQMSQKSFAKILHQIPANWCWCT